MLEVLRHYGQTGHNVAIDNFLPAGSPRFDPSFAGRGGDGPAVAWLDDNRYEASVAGIRIVQERLPISGPLWREQTKVVSRTIFRRVREYGAGFVFTVDDIPSLSSAFFAGLPGIHYFHSLANVAVVAPSGIVARRLLRERGPWVPSLFLGAKVKGLLDLDARVVNPLIDVACCRCESPGADPKAVGFITSHPSKGDTLFHRIAEALPSQRFFVAGWTYSLAHKNLPNVTYLGGLTDIRELFSRIDVLLVPSEVEEAFGRVIIEAAANGIPSIANRIGGIPEALGDSGILIDCGTPNARDRDTIARSYVAALTAIAADPALYADLCHKALRRAEEYATQQVQQLPAIP
jgi:glycosyltransferase involved in cell wall biosynthesis